MTLTADVFWSFRSPYSYLVTSRLVALVEETDLDLHVRPVLPIAIRTPEFFTKVNPLWPPYLFRDVTRVAAYEGLSLAWPRPDPVVQDLVNRTIPEEQPYIHRLTRLGVEACSRGRGLPFIHEISQIIWNGSVDGWDRGTHLQEATKRAGLDLVDLEGAIAKDPAARDLLIEQNQTDLEAAGHWGVPTMVFEGEPFFGQDRFDLFKWRLKEKGLRKR